MDMSAERFPFKRFIFDCSRSLSFFEFNEACIRGSEEICALSLKENPAIIIGKNSIELIITVFSLIRAGVSFAILHPESSLASVKHAAGICGASNVFTDLKRDFDFLEKRELIRCPSPLPDPIRENIITGFDDIAALEMSLSASDTLAAIFFSSSTSGKAPKGIKISHRNFIFSAFSINSVLKYKETDIVGLFLPLSFDVGFYQILLSLVSGCSVFVEDPSNISLNLPNVINDHEITVFPATPYLLKILIKTLARTKINQSIRLVTTTGEHASPELVGSVKDILPNCQINLMYGLTECKRVSILPTHLLEANIDTVGEKIPFTNVFHDRSIGRDERELIVYGPHVALGYVGEDNENFIEKEGFPFRFLRTGDIVEIDNKGFLRVKGRISQFEKYKDFRISPDEIETSIESIFPNSDAVVVFPTQDHMCLFIQSSIGVTQAELRTKCRAVLDSFKIPDEIRLVEEIPRTSNGKKDRKKLLLSY